MIVYHAMTSYNKLNKILQNALKFFSQTFSEYQNFSEVQAYITLCF